MEFTIKTAAPEKFKTGILVAGAFTDGPLPAATEALDALKGISTTPEPKKKSAKPKNETVIDLSGVSALAQKGYPAPVNLSRG